MRLIKFRIKNFKSIMDTGYCAFASDLTVLIGKNESGKTATLEALRFFDRSIQRVSEDAFPLDGSDRQPSVEIFFRLDPREVEAVRQETGLELSARALGYINQNGIGLIKDSRGRYRLSDECVGVLFRGEDEGSREDQIRHINSAKDKLTALLNTAHIPAIHFDSDEESVQNETKELVRVVKTYLPSLKDEETQNEAVDAIRTIIRESKKLTEGPPLQEPSAPAAVLPQEADDAEKRFVDGVVKHLPHFIFFSEFVDALPFEIPIPYLKENPAVLDFAKVSGMDIDAFMELQDVQRRINFLNRYSATINGDFLGYWQQDRVELIVKPDGEKLLFGAKEGEKTDLFKVNQRSKGFQWFLAFYLRLNAEKSKDRVILIDEPGTNLHAKAQKELLDVLEQKITTDSQVIFSTHCPYLIDPKRLDRVRLVAKEEKRGTFLTEDVRSSDDEDSLIPVATAMSEQSLSVQPVLGTKNVLVGAPADFYFCEAVKKMTNDPALKEISFLPAVDNNDLLRLVSMMIGNGLAFKVLLNNNEDGLRQEKLLKERFGFEDGTAVFVSRKPGYTTEDLLAFEDFARFAVTDGADGKDDGLNSEYLKSSGLSRVEVARKFFDAAGKAPAEDLISAESLAAFRRLFDKVLRAFQEPVREEAPELPKAEEPAPAAPQPKRRLFSFIKQ